MLLNKFLSSIGELTFEPSDTYEEVEASGVIVVEFASDQLLVSRDLKRFNSSATLFEKVIITIPQLDEQYSAGVEIDFHDFGFILVDDHFYPRDLLGFREVVTLIESIE
jgi:hypothetical protein